MKIDGYFKFEFSSASTRSSSMKYYVMSDNRQDMDMFLSQHGFHNVEDSITIIPQEEYKPKDGTHLLSIHMFASNKEHTIYHVMTCEDFITRALDNVANDTSDHSIFGEAILRTDVEFIKMAAKDLSSLRHAFVMDFRLADESLLFNHNENDGYKGTMLDMIAEYKNRIGAPSEDTGSQAILQSLYDACPDADTNCVYPITVEAYISTFTELMVDCYA